MTAVLHAAAVPLQLCCPHDGAVATWLSHPPPPGCRDKFARTLASTLLLSLARSASILVAMAAASALKAAVSLSASASRAASMVSCGEATATAALPERRGREGQQRSKGVACSGEEDGRPAIEPSATRACVCPADRNQLHNASLARACTCRTRGTGVSADPMREKMFAPLSTVMITLPLPSASTLGTAAIAAQAI